MKLSTMMTAAAAVALIGGAASAQQPQAPTPGSVTGDWNGSHAPSDDKQYKEKVVVPLGAAPASESTISATLPDTTVSTSSTASAEVAAADVSSTTVTSTTVTNGPVPDTAENRAKYGAPLSNAGKRTAARGN